MIHGYLVCRTAVSLLVRVGIEMVGTPREVDSFEQVQVLQRDLKYTYKVEQFGITNLILLQRGLLSVGILALFQPSGMQAKATIDSDS